MFPARVERRGAAGRQKIGERLNIRTRGVEARTFDWEGREVAQAQAVGEMPMTRVGCEPSSTGDHVC